MVGSPQGKIEAKLTELRSDSKSWVPIEVILLSSGT
jgi:hypothetical protein